MTARSLIAASILAADFAHLAQSITEAEDAGVDWIHIDVMDGRFVPNMAMGPAIVRTCRQITTLPLDVHLMVHEPIRFVTEFAEAGADHIHVHVEACTHLHRTLGAISDHGCRAGVAINPGTPLETLRPVLSLVDWVLVMTVNPGYSGQTFLPGSAERIEAVASMIADAGVPAGIEADGGIDAETGPLATAAGARALAAASAIFRHPAGIGEGVEALRRATTVETA